jgi:hypothetical protein
VALRISLIVKGINIKEAETGDKITQSIKFKLRSEDFLLTPLGNTRRYEEHLSSIFS